MKYSQERRRKSVAKGTDNEIEQRVREVKELLLVGDTRSEIVRYCANKWAVKSRIVDEYIARASEELREVGEANFEQNYNRVLKNYWRVYKRALNAGNTQEQRNTLNSIARITGLEVIRTREDMDKIQRERFKNLPKDEKIKLIKEALHVLEQSEEHEKETKLLKAYVEEDNEA